LVSYKNNNDWKSKTEKYYINNVQNGYFPPWEYWTGWYFPVIITSNYDSGISQTTLRPSDGFSGLSHKRVAVQMGG